MLNWIQFCVGKQQRSYFDDATMTSQFFPPSSSASASERSSPKNLPENRKTWPTLFSVDNFGRWWLWLVADEKKIWQCHLDNVVAFFRNWKFENKISFFYLACDKCLNDGLTNILQDLIVKKTFGWIPNDEVMINFSIGLTTYMAVVDDEWQISKISF